MNLAVRKIENIYKYSIDLLHFACDKHKSLEHIINNTITYLKNLEKWKKEKIDGLLTPLITSILNENIGEFKISKLNLESYYGLNFSLKCFDLNNPLTYLKDYNGFLDNYTLKISRCDDFTYSNPLIKLEICGLEGKVNFPKASCLLNLIYMKNDIVPDIYNHHYCIFKYIDKKEYITSNTINIDIVNTTVNGFLDFWIDSNINKYMFWTIKNSETIEKYNCRRFLKDINVLYFDRKNQKNSIKYIEIFNRKDIDIYDGNNINHDQKGIIVELEPVFTYNIEEAATDIKINIVDYKWKNCNDLSKGDGGKYYRYLSVLKDKNNSEKITFDSLKIYRSKNKISDNYKHTEDINLYRGGDYLYIIWETINVK